jgi:hypothetical protein
MSDDDEFRAHCPECDGYRLSEIRAEEVHRRTDDGVFDPEWREDIYRIVRCRGCNTRFFQIVSSNSDDMVESEDADGNKVKVPHQFIQHHPRPKVRARPQWAAYKWTDDDVLRRLLNEMYGAFNSDLVVLSAIGMRTVFDRATEVLGIDPGGTFAEKLDAMVKGGKIGTEECEQLRLLIDVGSAAAHRGWMPRLSHLETAALILEGFLHRAFVMPRKADAEKFKSVPQRPNRSA